MIAFLTRAAAEVGSHGESDETPAIPRGARGALACKHQRARGGGGEPRARVTKRGREPQSRPVRLNGFEQPYSGMHLELITSPSRIISARCKLSGRQNNSITRNGANREHKGDRLQEPHPPRTCY